MKKNYLSKTAMSANPLAMTVAKKSWQHTATTWLLLLFTVFGFADAFGQVANYTFSESTGTYTTIAGTTAIASGWDDTVTTNTIPIGFTFNFNGTNYTTCSINSNGYITFGATTSANNLFIPISDNTGYAGAISGFGVDLRDNNTRNILYTTTGTAPNRVFTVQWREARRFAEAGNLDFQIKLFETSNRIDIVYANFGLNNNNVNVQVGLRGANNTDFNNRSLTTTNTAWDNNTTAGGANNATCRSRNNNQPSNGRTFTWTPPTPPTITSFTPSSACASSSQTVVITGTNFTGATAVTIGGTAAASYVVNSATQITATIGTGTTGAIQVTTPGGSATSATNFTVNPLPAAIGGGATTVCVGGTTPAFTNATAGGTWSTSNANATINASGVLTGVTAGTVRVRYTLPTGCFVETTNITVQQPPSAIAGGAATVCVGGTTPAFTNAVAGGTWTVVNGTGTATLSPGRILTGVTAGIVTVNYTIGTCPPATFNVTVNPTPTAIGGGAATVCVGGTTPAFTNTVGGGTWSITNGTGSATISTSGVVTGVTAGGATVVYAIGSCSVTRAITITTVPVAAATPTPINGATGVCYSGTGAVNSISWGAAAGATSYDVYFGAGSVPATVTANVATNTYNTGALAANTTYYWRIVAKNACGDASSSATFIFTTATATCVCIPTATTDNGTGITNVIFNTINNSTSGASAYSDFTSISTSLMGTSTYPLTVRVNTAGNNTVNVRAWIDWNSNGAFEAAEIYNLGNATNVNNGATSASPFNISVPNTPGTYRMRVRATYNVTPTECGNQNYSEAEDYTINVFSPTPCVAPTTQPTALTLTPSGNFISGYFSPAVPTANSYLIVMNTTNVAPTPVNGTDYVIGNTIGAGNTVVGIGSGTTFVASGLTPSTNYYFFVYALNNLCTGGPLYNTTSPLNGTSSTTTANPSYCSPSPSVGAGFESLTYFTNISFVGTLNDVSNNSTYSSAPRGYQDFTTLPNVARQAQGQGVNISTQTTNRGYMKAWVDWNKDGDFLDAGEKVYDVGGIASYSTTFGFVIPALQAVGNYRIRIRISKDDSSFLCENFSVCNPDAISNFDACQNINYYGETEDYIFTVVASCSAVITAVTDGGNCGPGNVVLGATGSGAPTQYRWYTTEFGGTPVATTATGSWTTPLLAATTTYWVTAFNGCESLVRTKVVATISPLANLTFTPSVPEVCGENNVLSLTASGDKQLSYLVNEPFNSGLGVMINDNIVSNGGVTDGLTQWQNRPSTFVPAQQVWFPAIASGLNGNNFAMATSDVGSVTTHNAIMSPVDILI